MHDVPSAIYLDNSGNSYIVGGSYDSQDATDVALIKLNSSGTLVWQSTYDYAGLDEVPLSIKKWNMNGSVLEVTAISAASQGQWELAKIRFYSLTGGVQFTLRVTISQLSLADVYTFTADDSGNVYLASAVDGGINGKDMEIVKVTEAGVQWVQTIDYDGYDDYPRSMALDTSGNLLVAGSVQISGGSEILILKMAPDGTEIWRRSYRAPVYQKNARPVKLESDEAGNVYVTGTSDTESGVQDYTTFMYDTDGALKFEQKLDANSGSTDTPTDMVLSPSGTEIFVTGESVGTGGMEYVTVKYELRKRNDDIVYESGIPHHKAHELMVKFRPEFVNTSFVDDKTKRFGDIDEILPDSVISDFEKIYGIQLSKADVSKIFHRLTTAHQKSITRLGDTIDIPEFWSTFLFEFPAAENIDTLINRFNQAGEYVEYAEYNYLYQQQIEPDDNFFQNGWQQGLFAAQGDIWQGANINVEPAWDIETGQDYVKVGVYDDVIFWAHEDLGDGTLEGSQVVGGWDFYNNVDIAGVTNPRSHGTACAGVIGAIRDNGIGIAGIAGGGPDAQGNEGDGVQLFSLGISSNAVYLESENIAPAIVEGSMYDASQNPTGYGLHIQNHSWGGEVKEKTISRAIEFCFRNQCTFVAARGNYGTDQLLYPACTDDNWVLTVGASGTDGELFQGSGINGNQWASNDPGSSFGGGMDVIAPGVSELILSLINPNLPLGGTLTQGANNDYQPFYRTSAAAPHVAGVAALMYSEHNINNGQSNNLAPDDIEFLLERYADEVNNGWRRINAFEVISRLEPPRWQVFHSGEPDERSEELDYETIYIDNTGAGFVWKVFLVTHTYHYEFPPGTQIIDAWPRFSSTVGNPEIGLSFPTDKDWASYQFNFVQNSNEIDVTVETYRLDIEGLIEFSELSYEEIKTAFSLHLFNPNATNVDNLDNLGVFEIFPNPNKGELSIHYELFEAIPYSLQILDITGKVILKKEVSSQKTGTIILDILDASSGIYICQLLTNKGTISKKAVKH